MNVVEAFSIELWRGGYNNHDQKRTKISESKTLDFLLLESIVYNSEYF